MNNIFAMKSDYANTEGPVKVNAPQTVETWHEEENEEWHEQVTIPGDVPDTLQPILSQPAIPEALKNQPVSWLTGDEVDDLQSRWKAIQIEFVDEPHKSVEQADALVVEALKRIEQAFTNQRMMLNEQWLNHEDIQTEDLRISLQSYRSFLNRILAL